MLINISEEEVLEMLMNRVHHWTDSKKEIDLYRSMYENYVYGGVFDSGSEEFDVMSIVDNDYVNWCSTVYKDDKEFIKIKKVFEEQGLGDCSCEDCEGNYIEAVDSEDNPTMFLIRW